MSQSSVIALEFRGIGDPSNFGFLNGVRGLAGLCRLDPLTSQAERYRDLDEQAKVLIEDLPAEPEVVIAHCGSAALGVHIAARTTAHLVLVDPYPTTSEIAYRDFEKLCERIGCYPGPPASTLADREAQLVGMRKELSIPFGGDEEALDMVDDLLERYRSWLRFLQASVVAPAVAPNGPVTVVAGKPLSPLEPLLVRPQDARVVRLATDGDTLQSAAVHTFMITTVRNVLRGDLDRA
jgi:hypothetical protein